MKDEWTELHPSDKDLGKGVGVGGVEVGGGLIEREDAAVEAERLCQRQPDY